MSTTVCQRGLWGFDPAAGVYIDDVYLARPQATLLDVLDVRRLEVLCGPQGTLCEARPGPTPLH